MEVFYIRLSISPKTDIFIWRSPTPFLTTPGPCASEGLVGSRRNGVVSILGQRLDAASPPSGMWLWRTEVGVGGGERENDRQKERGMGREGRWEEGKEEERE